MSLFDDFCTGMVNGLQLRAIERAEELLRLGYSEDYILRMLSDEDKKILDAGAGMTGEKIANMNAAIVKIAAQVFDPDEFERLLEAAHEGAKEGQSEGGKAPPGG